MEKNTTENNITSENISYLVDNKKMSVSTWKIALINSYKGKLHIRNNVKRYWKITQQDSHKYITSEGWYG